MLLNCTPEVPFKLMSKLPPMLNVPLLFNIALVPMLPDEPLVMVTAPELFHTAPVPSVNPPDGTETLPALERVPSNVPPVQFNAPDTMTEPVACRVPPVKLKAGIVVEGTRLSVPPLSASVPAPLTEPCGVMVCVPPLNCKVLPDDTLKAPVSVELPL